MKVHPLQTPLRNPLKESRYSPNYEGSRHCWEGLRSSRFFLGSMDARRPQIVGLGISNTMLESERPYQLEYDVGRFCYTYNGRTLKEEGD